MNETSMMKKEETGIAELTHDRPVFLPLTDIFEREECLYVTCDMPGVEEKNLDISLENDTLTLTGIQEAPSETGMEILEKGFVSGIYQRVFTLPDEIDRERIKASLKNGVLRLELPKSEKSKSRKIQIQVEP